MAEDKVLKKATIAAAPFSGSPVDILIPFHNSQSKVMRLMESILSLTRSNPIQVTLIDDGSDNSEFGKEFERRTGFWTRVDQRVAGSHQRKVVLLRNEKHIGFGAALTLGYRSTGQPWVVVMHSDCEVKDPGWLLEMGRSLLRLKSQGVRMVSAKSNNPGTHVDPRLKADAPQGGEDIIFGGCLPLYCALSHRDLYRHINGFVKSYPIYSYEDEELSNRIRHFGFKVAICGNSWVYHEGGGTVNELCKNKSICKIIEANREKCVADIQSLKKKR